MEDSIYVATTAIFYLPSSILHPHFLCGKGLLLGKRYQTSWLLAWADTHRRLADDEIGGKVGQHRLFVVEQAQHSLGGGLAHLDHRLSHRCQRRQRVGREVLV